MIEKKTTYDIMDDLSRIHLLMQKLKDTQKALKELSE